MALRVIGAGVGRTGTRSLQAALQRLLGGPCYHMAEVFAHPSHVEPWHQAVKGRLPPWDEFFAGYQAVVDWPASAFWRELSAAYPDVLVVLSVRESPEVWWESACRTILEPRDLGRPPPGMEAIWAMFLDLLHARFTDQWHDREAAMAAYVRHNEAVRAQVPAEHLIEWQPGDGWDPICTALGLPVPTDAFPHLNAVAEFEPVSWACEPPRPSDEGSVQGDLAGSC